MNKLIQLVNDVQNALSLVDEPRLIDFPQLVVVGSQSSGKSSVLESIVGQDFLPRGDDMVTRCPLVLQLVNAPDGGTTEWGEFLHSARRFTDFAEIRAEIEREMERVAGPRTERAVSPRPIGLRIHSSRTPNLTLVDCPGLTKVPVGRQPRDVEAQVYRIVHAYAANPDAIVLAVSAANTDLATSDALKLAREVDPSGIRTVGVLTKLDLMDRGTNAAEILGGGIYSLRHGFVGVVNRSQQDIRDAKPMAESLRQERAFFTRGAAAVVYTRVADRCGIPNLVALLNRLFLAHVRKSIPKTVRTLREQLGRTRDVLAGLEGPYGGGSLATDIAARRQALAVATIQFVLAYTSAVGGVVSGGFSEGSRVVLSGGSRSKEGLEALSPPNSPIHTIARLFYPRLGKALRRVAQLQCPTDEEIETVVANALGVSGGFFVPERALGYLVARHVSGFADPAMHCLQATHQALGTLLARVRCSAIERFPRLRTAMLEAFQRILDARAERARKALAEFCAMEAECPNFYHPDFLRGRGGGDFDCAADGATRADRSCSDPQEPATAARETSEASPPGAAPARSTRHGWSPAAGLTKRGFWRRIFMPQSSPTRDRGTETGLPPLIGQSKMIRALLEDYAAVVQRTFEDRVPKIIVRHLVVGVREDVEREAVADVFARAEDDDQLVAEDPEIAERRARHQRILGLLEGAIAMVQEIHEGPSPRSRGGRIQEKK